MRNFFYAILAIVIIAAIIIAINWNSIVAWWNRPKDGDKCMLPNQTEGVIKNGQCVNKALSCQQEYDDAKAEFVKSGKSCVQTVVDVVCASDSSFVVSVNPCVEKILKDKGWKSPDQNANNSNANNTSSGQYDAQVSNPNGAFMYYQSDLASGGKLYSKSNLNLPYGTKLKLTKIWQTNVSTQPFSGYYETTYKQYGPTSGFFDTKDLIKI